MTLDEFLRREASLPPYPGACCRMVDKWIREVTGFSALGRFGRDFHNDEDVRQWLAEPGGIAVAVNRVMRACGYQKTKEPQVGDVGLVVHRERLAMAIRGRDAWLGRDDAGMFCAASGAVWKAWRIR